MSLALACYTAFHTLISLFAIVVGIVITYELLVPKRIASWTLEFWVSTFATSVTGFFFPVHHLMPSHIVGIISVIVLAIAGYAIYGRKLAGQWRWIYIVSAMIAFYLNMFVLTAQMFAKIPPLHQLAPTQSEGPFIISQLVLLATFVGITFYAVLKFPKGSPALATGALSPAQ